MARYDVILCRMHVFRSLMVSLVLATDMENHFSLVTKMKHLAADVRPLGPQKPHFRPINCQNPAVYCQKPAVYSSTPPHKRRVVRATKCRMLIGCRLTLTPMLCRMEVTD